MFGIQYSDKKRLIKLSNGKVIIPNCIKSLRPEILNCMRVGLVDDKKNKLGKVVYQYTLDGYVLFGDDMFVNGWLEPDILNELKNDLKSMDTIKDKDLNNFIDYARKNGGDENLGSFLFSYYSYREYYQQLIQELSEASNTSENKLAGIFQSVEPISEIIYNILIEVINLANYSKYIKVDKFLNEIKQDKALSQDVQETYSNILNHISVYKNSSIKGNSLDKLESMADNISASTKLGMVIFSRKVNLIDKNNNPIIISEDTDETVLQDRNVRISFGGINILAVVADIDGRKVIGTLEDFSNFISKYANTKRSESKILNGYNLLDNNPNANINRSDMTFLNNTWELAVGKMDANNIRRGILELGNGLVIDFKVLRNNPIFANKKSSIKNEDERTLLYKELSNEELLDDFVNKIKANKDMPTQLYQYYDTLYDNLKLIFGVRPSSLDIKEIQKKFKEEKNETYAAFKTDNKIHASNEDKEYFDELLKSINLNPKYFTDDDTLTNPIKDEYGQRRYRKSTKTSNELGVDDSSNLRDVKSWLDRFDASYVGGLKFDWDFIAYTAFRVNGCKKNNIYNTDSGMRKFFGELLTLAKYGGGAIGDKFDNLLTIVKSSAGIIQQKDIAAILKGSES